MNKINFIEENFKVKRWYFDKAKFVLDGQQKMMLQHLEENNRVVITSARCCGVSTVGAAFVALELASSTKDNPVKMVILCKNKESSIYFFKEVCYFLGQIDGFDDVNGITHRSIKKHYFSNGAEIYVRFNSMDALKRFRYTHIITDDGGIIKSFNKQFQDINFTLAKKVIFLSTGQVKKGDVVNYILSDEKWMKQYKHFHLHWWGNPRFNDGLIWNKFDESGKLIETIQEVDYDLQKMTLMFEDGFVPTSHWVTVQIKILGEEHANMEFELGDIKNFIQNYKKGS